MKHFPVEFEGGKILFGRGVFSTWEEFLQHFSEKPLIGGGDSGTNDEDVHICVCA